MTVFATAKPEIASSSRRRLGQPIVAAVNGTAATADPIA